MFGKCRVIRNGKFFPFLMTVGNGEKFWSSRWYKISLWSAEIQMDLGQWRSTRRSCSIKEGVLRNFAILTENHLCWSLFLTNAINASAFLWILRNFKNPFLKDHLRTAAYDYAYQETFLGIQIASVFFFSKNVKLSYPNFPLFRFLSIFSLEI